ncbi:MAG: glycosyltransferase [Actinomycetota bacterium]|nr:glycosyltransferase [Actinomycetota bacterium]
MPRSLAVLSLHTSPLAQPGSGDGGGMNVYVRSLASALARAGLACDVWTRAEHADQPEVVVVEPSFRVLHVQAGPREPLPKEALPELVDEFTAVMLDRVQTCGRDYDALHGNYWLSGQVAHRLKHELSLPMLATFHTLARVTGSDGGTDGASRAAGEDEIIRCADLILASTTTEAAQLRQLYGADPERVEVLPPGVDHRLFSPGDRRLARARLGHPGDRVVLFVGRVQPLKGLELAVESLAETDGDSVLWVVGGPSGAEGPAELARVKARAGDLGVAGRVLFLPPVPHSRLVDYYRAADVVVVPSRSESFGLVALEAAACGTPVVAAAVGGLTAIVEDGVTGFLVEGRDPLEWATAVSLLLDDPELATAMGAGAAVRSGRWSWSMTAARLRRLCADLMERTPVECS